MKSEEIKSGEEDNKPSSGRRRRTKAEFKKHKLEQAEKSEKRGCTATILIILALLGVGIYLWSSAEKDTPDEVVAVVQKEAVVEVFSKVSATKWVAKKFMLETDVEKRLELVRNPERVRTHLSSYSKEALESPGLNLRLIGRNTFNGIAKTAYSVELESGDFRLLNVLESDDGLKVDWDSYARYSSVSWQTLAKGFYSTSAVVRVFVQPGFYYVGEYADQAKWVCFKLATVDWREPFYAYGRVGEQTTTRMSEIVQKAQNGGEFMTLKVTAKPKEAGANMMELKEILAERWVVADEAPVDVESSIPSSKSTKNIFSLEK